MVNARPVDEHRATTLDQFTRQATGFSSAPTMNDVSALEVLAEAAALTGTETVLDVACGPGIVSAFLAARAGSVTGIDVTPAMIALAEERCATAGNTRFVTGEVVPLPFEDAFFDVVVCRYALHHLLDPAAAIAEMARVCTPTGRVVLVDMEGDPDRARSARLDACELARDPSHVRACTAAEIAAWCEAARLAPSVHDRYRIEVDVEPLLLRSASPDPDRVRQLLAAEAELPDGGRLAVERQPDGTLRFAYPTLAIVAHPGAV